jgi:hypothetical protein
MESVGYESTVVVVVVWEGVMQQRHSLACTTAMELCRQVKTLYTAHCTTLNHLVEASAFWSTKPPN